MAETKTIDIEHAIETVRQFSISTEARTVPTLAYFELKDGKLQIHTRNKLEETLVFTKDCILAPFFPKKQKKAINRKLQESLNLLKVYSQTISEMQNQILAKEVLSAAEQYNAMVRRVKSRPATFAQKLKNFFLSLAGWALDEELIQTEIHIPKKNSTVQKLTNLLHNVQKRSELERTQPKKEELDAFRLKAITLLGEEENSFQLVHQYPIESTLNEQGQGYGLSLISLRQVIKDFPGEEIALTGSFKRDSFYAELCFPEKESFQVSYSSVQSGFPHPLQYIGISFHEKWLPTFMLRPKMAQKLSLLLEKKQLLSKAILPGAFLNARAKKLLHLRRCAFQNDKTFLTLLEEVLAAMVNAAGLDPQDHIRSFFTTPPTYDEIGAIHESVVASAICKPLEVLQHEWLFNNNPNIQSLSFCRQIVDEVIAKEYPTSSYQQLIGKALAKAVPALYLMQLSEHLKIVPPHLSDFEMMILTSLFRQSLAFAYELETLSLDPIAFESYFLRLFEEEKALFCNLPQNSECTLQAKTLLKEMIGYYKK